MERLERHLGRHPKTVVDAIEVYLKRYLVMDESNYLPIAAWVMAAWLCDLSEFDRFPHLAVTSAEPLVRARRGCWKSWNRLSQTPN